jgi:integrase
MTKTRREKIGKRVVDATDKHPDRDVFVWDTEVKGFRLRVRPTGRKIYEVRYRRGSRQRLFTIGQHGSPWTAEDARSKAISILRDVEHGDDPQLGREEERRALTVSELVAHYLDKGPADKPDKRASSWATDTYNLKRHVEPLLGTMVARDLTSADLSDWQASVATGRTATRANSEKKRGRVVVKGGPGAAARAMRTLAAMLAWAESRGILTSNPATRVQKLKDGRRERYLTEEEAIRLWAAVNDLEAHKEGGITEAQAAAFRLMMLTGARRSEILGLRWPEVDLRRRLLLLPPFRHKSGGHARPKAIPLSEKAADIVSKLPRTEEFVFEAKGGDGPMTPPKRAWAKVLAKAEVTDASFHVLRHTLASFAIADGASLYVVGKTLGHAKAETTQRYAHLRDDVAARTTEAASARYLAKAMDSTSNGPDTANDCMDIEAA